MVLMIMQIYNWRVPQCEDKKGELTFIDIIAVVRRSIWSKRFSKSADQDDLVKIIDQDVALILDQLAMAA